MRSNRLQLARYLFIILAAGSLVNGFASTWAGPQKVDIAEGIYLFISPDVGADVDGNSIAVVTDHDILVFDSNVLPATARNVLTEIRKLTSKPVRYVVNSHWHPDHWDGNEMYAKEFPDLEIIANQETRRLMESTMKVYVKTLEHQSAQADQEIANDLKTGKSSDGTVLSEKDRKDLQEQQRLGRDFMSEYRSMHPVLPTLTYGDKLTLFHGGREFRIMHFVGNTVGDTALYLPKEKTLLTGDLLVYPVPYCADSHPTAWIESLRTLARLDATTIIPGHGQAQHDMNYMNLVIDSLQTVVDQVHEALQRGMTLEETKKFVNLDAIRLKFAHNDPDLNASFDGNFAPIVRQAYDEATEELELYQ
jgi:glyoxylase-like metal-dependent hydrolase (beta-lactamase superfamily II)